MSSTITGIGSGFDIDGWVSQLVAAKESSTITPLQQKLSELQSKNTAVSGLKSKFSSLQTSIQKFTKAVYNSSSDMWSKSKIKSSNDAYITASASGTVAASSLEIKVQQIATSTVAKSNKSLGAINAETINNTKFVNLANGQAKAGEFSMFLDGKEYDIEIGENDTVADVIRQINEKTEGKIVASVSDNGIFSIVASDENSVLTLGSGGDESNLASALKLHDAIGTHGYSSSHAISTVNSGAAMYSAESGLGEIRFFNPENESEAESGKIFINGVEFSVDKNTSLDTLISKINGNSDAGVSASYDSLTNKLILTSKQTGQSNISLSEEGTNILNVLGLTEMTENGEILAKDSQVLGQNAIAYINGNKVISTSNTITGESSGISNLSITIKKPTSEYSGNPDDEASITLDIEADYSEVKSALENFVKAYNDAVDTAKSYAKSDGAIGNDSALNSLVSSLRALVSKVSENDGTYSMLAEIGINTSNTDAVKLSIDSSKLDDALAKNFDSVKSLLSDGFTSKTDNGLFDSLITTVDAALNSETGYFSQKTESFDTQIETMNKRIERANEKLLTYQTRITKQFNQMDSVIASLNSQMSTLSSFLGI